MVTIQYYKLRERLSVNIGKALFFGAKKLESLRCAWGMPLDPCNLGIIFGDHNVVYLMGCTGTPAQEMSLGKRQISVIMDKQEDIKCMDREEAFDYMEEIKNIEDIKINAELPKETRIKQFVDEIKNPYRFMVDDVIVNVVFTEDRSTLQDRLQQYLQLVMT